MRCRFGRYHARPGRREPLRNSEHGDVDCDGGALARRLPCYFAVFSGKRQVSVDTAYRSAQRAVPRIEAGSAVQPIGAAVCGLLPYQLLLRNAKDIVQR